MFRHGYICHDMLAEVGPLNDGKVRTHRSLQLIYGVNKPFRIRLEGKWQELRLCLIDQGVEHFISGEDDWQICYFVYPDSHLGHLLKSRILKGASVSILSQDENPTRIRTEQPAVRPMSISDIRGLLESFVYLFTGCRAFLRRGTNTADALYHVVRESERALTLEQAAGVLGMDRQILMDRFKRETELEAGTWLLHTRMMRFFDSLESMDIMPDDQILDRVARECGIAGLPGMDRMFEDFFGMAYKRWVNSNPGTIILTEDAPLFVSFQDPDRRE